MAILHCRGSSSFFQEIFSPTGFDRKGRKKRRYWYIKYNEAVVVTALNIVVAQSPAPNRNEIQSATLEMMPANRRIRYTLDIWLQPSRIAINGAVASWQLVTIIRADQGKWRGSPSCGRWARNHHPATPTPIVKRALMIAYHKNENRPRLTRRETTFASPPIEPFPSRRKCAYS